MKLCLMEPHPGSTERCSWLRKMLIYGFWLGQKDTVFWLLPAVLADSWDQCNGRGRFFVFQGAYVI